MKNEDVATSVVEEQTRKIPSISLLALSIGAMAVSAGLMLVGNKKWKEWGLFFGQWVPSILVMGTYNKIAKTFSAPYSEEQRVKHGDNRSPLKFGSQSEYQPQGLRP
jgi:hypothetical protein